MREKAGPRDLTQFLPFDAVLGMAEAKEDARLGLPVSRSSLTCNLCSSDFICFHRLEFHRAQGLQIYRNGTAFDRRRSWI